VAAAWDVAAVHRLLFGEWRAEPARAWARLQDLPLDTLPTTQPLDLFSHADWTAQDPDDPLGPDGHLNPGWLDGGWAEAPTWVQAWAALAGQAAYRQQERVAVLVADRPKAAFTAGSESAAELLCAEMAIDGLPLDRATAEELIADYVGPAPHRAPGRRSACSAR